MLEKPEGSPQQSCSPEYARFGLVGCSHKEYRHESLIRPLAYILRIRRDFEFGEKWTKWWDV